MLITVVVVTIVMSVYFSNSHLGGMIIVIPAGLFGIWLVAKSTVKWRHRADDRKQMKQSLPDDLDEELKRLLDGKI